MKEYDIIIIGASAAGISAAEHARKVSDSLSIACLTEETRAAYYRPLLTELMGNPQVVNKPAFTVRPASWFTERRVDLYTKANVSMVDVHNHVIATQDGREFSWKRCIFATGSEPFVPLPETLQLPGVFTCRTWADAEAIEQAARHATNVVVIGGGLLGLEAAHFLNTPGRLVTVIELMPRILPRQLDEPVSQWFAQRIQKTGVRLLTSTQVRAIEQTPAGTLRLETSSGELTADVALFSIGVRPRVDLAKKANLTVNRGIVVDPTLRTSHPDVFACGDAAEFCGQVWALWMPAIRMGQVAGHNAAASKSEERTYTPTLQPAALSAFSTRIFSVGRLEGELEARLVDLDHGVHLYFENDVLVGALLWGDTTRGMTLVKAIEQKASRSTAVALL